MDKKEATKIAIAPTLVRLEIGETAEYPMQRYNVVRSTCTNISITHPSMRFSTTLDRDSETITVTRTA